MNERPGEALYELAVLHASLSNKADVRPFGIFEGFVYMLTVAQADPAYAAQLFRSLPRNMRRPANMKLLVEETKKLYPPDTLEVV